MRNALEKQKLFPLVAWFIFLGFASLVLFLAIQLQKTTDELSLKTSANIEAIKNTP